MANITLTFSTPIPDTFQVNDFVWYVNSSTNEEIKIGTATSIDVNTLMEDGIDNWIVVIDALNGVVPPSQSDFIFFEKAPQMQVGSLKGYYAEAVFKNDSTEYSELYSVGAEIFESSK